jgi:hypothetical protein
MRFLKAYGLAVLFATATLSVMTYVRWMLTLSDTSAWLRNSFPVRFHWQHIAELVEFPLIVALLCTVVFFFPVLLAYLLARHWRIANLAYYLSGAVVCALAFSWLCLIGDLERRNPLSYLSVLIHLLPASVAGATAFWWSASRQNNTDRAVP